MDDANPAEAPEQFGNALRHVRRVHRLSQRQLAERLDVSRARISRLELGDLGLPVEAAVALYRTLGYRLVLSHDFPCSPPPDAPDSGSGRERPRRCETWLDDGTVCHTDDAGRAFPAHGEAVPGFMPSHWGDRYGWGATDRVPWERLPGGPRAVVAHGVDRAGQDGGMSSQTHAEAYAELRPELEKATALFVELVTSLLDEAGINYLSVTGRTKSVASFAAKAERVRDGAPQYPAPLTDITDLVGVRVITYVHDDVAAVAELLAHELAVLDDRDLGLETARSGRFGYASRHLLVAVDASRTVPTAYESLRRLSASVQIRTVLQHAWAEFEHDIRYKGTVPEEHAHDLDRRFTLAAGLIELADREFSAIRDRLQMALPATPESDLTTAPDPRIRAQDLAKFLATTYADAGWSRTDHYTWVSGLLLELGITSVDDLAAVIEPVDSADLIERMGYAYPPGAVRRLDDALLATYGTRYLDLEGNAHRRASLATRLERLGGS